MDSRHGLEIESVTYTHEINAYIEISHGLLGVQAYIRNAYAHIDAVGKFFTNKCLIR